MNETRKADLRKHSGLINAGAIQRVPARHDPIIQSKAPDAHQPHLSREEEQRCRSGLLTLRRILTSTRTLDLARRRVERIIIWDPDDPQVCCRFVHAEPEVNASESGPERFRRDYLQMKIRRQALNAIQWALSRHGGLDALVTVTGVRVMVLSSVSKVLSGDCAPGAFLCQQVNSHVPTTEVYSIRPLGWVDWIA